MSLNDGLTSKQRARVELEKLVANYNGPINRSRSQRVIVACVCGARRSVATENALKWKFHCLRCGAEVKPRW